MLHEIAEKTVLNITFEKTQIIDATTNWKTTHGLNKKEDKFKNVGKCPNGKDTLIKIK